MPGLDRTRRQPKAPRRAVLAGSPAFPVAPEAEAPEKPQKRATRKRAPKAETDE